MTMPELEEAGMLLLKLVAFAYLLGHWMALLVFANYFIGSFVIGSYSIWAKLISLVRTTNRPESKLSKSELTASVQASTVQSAAEEGLWQAY